MAKKGKTVLQTIKDNEASAVEKDPVFGDSEGDAGEARPPKKVSGRLIQPTKEEVDNEIRRKHDNRIGLLIGPKNLVKLRTFGYEVSMVNPDGLSSGVAHRGMNE